MVEIQKEMELLRMGVSANGPKFRVGQSVHQWWAGWMMEAKEGDMPKTYKKNNRPAWYSAEVVAMKQERVDIEYAGIAYKQVYVYRGV